MPGSVRQGPVVTRGVFLSPFPQEGYDVAVAVTSQGVRVAGIILMPGVDWNLAYDVLTLVLEVADPEQTPAPKQTPKGDRPLWLMPSEPLEGPNVTAPIPDAACAVEALAPAGDLIADQRPA